jgi:hypothetical protein
VAGHRFTLTADRPRPRARLNTVFMGSAFLGGASIVLLAFLLWAWTQFRARGQAPQG